jgi:AhpD family alkylhydroperoxidase
VTAGAGDFGERTIMQPRMKNPAITVPGAMEALQQLGAAARRAGVPETTLYLIEARASQINGCTVCLDMHSRELKAAGEPDERVFVVGAWREAPYFNDAERAALALTEATTRLADRSEPVPDEVWEEAARHYNEAQLAGLVVAIAAINAWNRINVATRQITGEWVSEWVAQPQPAGRTA